MHRPPCWRDQVISQIAKEAGAAAELPEIKSTLRALEKIVLDYAMDPLMMTDLVRGKIRCTCCSFCSSSCGYDDDDDDNDDHLTIYIFI